MTCIAQVYRSQGKLTSRFGYDAMGRKSWQFTSSIPSEKLSQIQNPGINTSLLVNHAYNPIHRRYEYDPAGELTRTLDKLRGEIKYEYEANGQLHSRDTGRLVDSEEFRYDAAANRLNFNTSQFDQVKDNRIKQWRDQEYTYDAWGNLIEKRSGLTKLQTFTYDCENRLVRAETMVNSQVHSVGTYRHDSLGRRIGKTSEINGEAERKQFLWQGLRMLREEAPGHSSLYIYEPGSYAPLARVDQGEGEVEQKLYYFHTDQIGTPLEMTDVDGQIVWQATYKAWGEIETLAVNEVEQNLRFQGQYFDDETHLHYNTFRYYDPEIGRFITQDPIGLAGGYNLYRYAPNPNTWIDPWGWAFKSVNFEGSNELFPVSGNQKNIVTIEMQGSRGRDFTEAYKQAGLREADVKAQGKYTWHHLDDFDPRTGKSTMQLVTRSAHEASLPHTGSVAQFEKHFGLPSGSYGGKDAVGISQSKGWLKGRAPSAAASTC